MTLDNEKCKHGYQISYFSPYIALIYQLLYKLIERWNLDTQHTSQTQILNHKPKHGTIINKGVEPRFKHRSIHSDTKLNHRKEEISIMFIEW